MKIIDAKSPLWGINSLSMKNKTENKILIVDDEEEQLRALQLGLRRKGYTVATAKNGTQAFARLCDQDGGFDMVVTDFAMPGMDGLTFLKKIRSQNKHLAVMMMTAYGKKEVLVDALRNQCNGFIEKPFTMSEFIDEIERVRSNIQEDENSCTLSDVIPFLVHQINNPLYVIKGSAEMGLYNLENDALKKSLQNIIHATERIHKINQEIINLGRGIENRTECLCLNNVLAESIDFFQEQLDANAISIERNLHNHKCYIQGNKFGLEQMFKNLILNAIEAMETEPTKTLAISLVVKPLSSKAHIFIKDSGCGMAKEIQDRIFESYFTLKAHGTGLGLAVTKYVADKHHGSIDISSKAGKGTLFKVTLPITECIKNQ